jgi:eukaryotic-like serine/threonine-protein kinase
MIDPELPATLGPYEVLSRLSRGGMGEVLLGRRRGAHGFERLVALKILRQRDSARADREAMFLDEARLAAQLTHPAVAQVYDFGDDDGRLWLAMEYVAGVSFNELAASPPMICARLVAEACRGLHAAHELKDREGKPLKVVHRDISPDNLRLGFDGQVKVLDFGIALVRTRQQPVTQAGMLKGKLRYMAPEQVRSDAVDRRIDVYALGIVLHELLTGRDLLTDADALAALNGKPRKVVPPSQLQPYVPPELDAVVMKAMADDPEARFATALELHETLMALSPGTSLERFTAEALKEKAERHRVWMQQVLEGSAPTKPGPAAPPLRKTVAEGEGLASTTEEAVAPPRRSAALGIALGIAVVAVGGFGWLMLREPEAVTAPQHNVAPAKVVEAPAPERNVDVDMGDLKLDERAQPKSKPPPSHPRSVPAAVAPAVPTEPKGSGVVKIVAAGDAYGVVRIDGSVIGPTPLSVTLKAGSHLVEVLRPDTNAVELSQRVELRDGDVQRVVAQ